MALFDDLVPPPDEKPETKGRPPVLEDFTRDGPILSKPCTFRGREFRFRLLTRHHHEVCRILALKHVRGMLSQYGLPDDWISIDHVKDVYENWVDVFRLEAAMRDEGNPVLSGADDSARAEKLGQMLSPDEHAKLTTDYLNFQNDEDPLRFDPLLIAECREAIESRDPFRLTSFGSHTLAVSICTMDSQDEDSESEILAIASALGGTGSLASALAAKPIPESKTP